MDKLFNEKNAKAERRDSRSMLEKRVKIKGIRSPKRAES